MRRSLGIMDRLNAILVRRSSISILAMVTIANSIFILLIPRSIESLIYSTLSSITISLLTIGAIRDSLESFSRALLYCGGSRYDRIVSILYISLTSSIPSYVISLLLSNPYISILTTAVAIYYARRTMV